MHLKEIWIYPVKGMQGIKVASAQLTPLGLQYDRRYMLVDANGKFISQRTHPQLATLSTSLQGDVVTLSDGREQVELSPAIVTTTQVASSMWEHKFTVHLLPGTTSAKVSAMIGDTVRVAYLTDEDIRIKHYIGDGDSTRLSLADGYPYLLAGTSSLDKLNSKLTSPVPMDRFRANLIIETTEPHIEDKLGHFTVGGQSMYVVKPCARCQVITIDQRTGAGGKEPTATLAKYRKEGNKINFGANAVANSDGVVRVGDEVTADVGG